MGKTWPTNAAESGRMRAYRAINVERALRNPNENWMAAHLATTGLRWARQVCWGFRIFDFWCPEKGIAVEVDGAEHRPGWDRFRDEQDLRRSAIVVLRVRNRNEEDAARALAAIREAGPWKDRRATLPQVQKAAAKAARRAASPAPVARPAPPAPAPQPRCPSCGQRVRKRRPDGAVRCRCGATRAPAA